MNVLVFCTKNLVPKILKDLQADPMMHVQSLSSFDEVTDYLKTYDYDGLVLFSSADDQELMDVIAFIKEIRKQGLWLPLLMVEADHPFDIKMRICFLNAGADEIVNCEMRLEEFAARFKSILRRYKGKNNTIIELNGLRVDMDQHEVYVGDVLVDLTHKEHDLLECLVRNMGRVMSKEQLLFSVYGGMDEPEIRIIDAFVWRIRRKLRRAGLKGECLYTVWGRGYRFDRPAKPA